MTNPTPQDREMADKAFDIAFAGDTNGIDEAMAALFTTARLQGRREGLEEAARVAWDLAVDYDKHWRAQVVAAIRTLYGAEPDKDGEP